MTAGRTRHWKHGWIPISPEAKAYVAGKGPNPTTGRWSAPGPKGTSFAKTRIRVKGQGESFPPSMRKRVGAANLQDKMKKDGGFTYDPRKGGLVEVGSVQGIAVAKPGTEQQVGKGDISRGDFINAVSNVIMDHRDDFANGAMLGGWYSPDRDAYMVEVTDVFQDRTEGIKAGINRNQEGVFDLGTGEFIPTGGTGDG